MEFLFSVHEAFALLNFSLGRVSLRPFAHLFKSEPLPQSVAPYFYLLWITNPPGPKKKQMGRIILSIYIGQALATIWRLVVRVGSYRAFAQEVRLFAKLPDVIRLTSRLPGVGTAAIPEHIQRAYTANSFARINALSVKSRAYRDV